MMKIGCDPEFLPILRIPQDPYKVAKSGGRYGLCYDYWKNTSAGNIGSDAGQDDDIGELRPKAGTPKEVVNNLRKMIKHLQNKKIIYDLIAGGGGEYKEALGGHIHFDLDLGDEGISSRSANRLQRHLFMALDHYIGIPLKKKKGGKRYGSSYGRLSDIRSADHGSKEGFEYRTPPSWLVSPELAESVLWTAWAITQCYNDDRSFWLKHASRIKAKSNFKLKDLELIKGVCKEHGQNMIDLYGKIVKDRKFDLGQKGAIKNWTGKIK